MYRSFFFIVFLCCFGIGNAQIIPAPMNLESGDDHFILNEKVGFKFVKVEENFQSFLTEYITNEVEDETAVYIHPQQQARNISFERIKGPFTDFSEEGYTLQITEEAIKVKATTEAGLFYGAQSLLQLISSNNTQTPIQLPNLEIDDEPQVGWRGMMLDVSRHFYTADAIKEVLDLMAFYKLNVFHWHLADNEGWRLEIEKYPKLTSVGAWRSEIPGSLIYKKDSTYAEPLNGKPYPYGGFYTQKQVREIVKYAQERNITVVPEIDVPGHSGAALSAYPEFSCEKHLQDTPNSTLWNGVVDPLKVNLNYCPGQEKTFAFLEDILTEVMELFPSEYIHIGGDEVDKSYWEKCPACQRRMAEEGLATEEELQSYFIKRVGKFLEKNGRKLIGWDEILEGGAPENATVMSWRGTKGGIAAAKSKREVIMTPSNPLYFNRVQANPEDEPYGPDFSINTLERVYAYELYPDELTEVEQEFIKGSQFAIWTEFISSVEHLQYILFPRMPAFAENMWSAPENKDFNDFLDRLNSGHYDYWKRNGIRFHPKHYERSVY